ncbi:MAG TPA: tripartite tricarboxylate transporter substrate binding protein [Burkholderiales bacterium]|jgi:tripartite-type tricarboxylate transporter receptor subunit TctC|nr:tripartite tricarboxylate transporter substrate binding protein [Burkholderiales bacterium]
MSRCTQAIRCAGNLVLACAYFVAALAAAQSYPTKPIRLLVPFPPGAGADVVARTLAQKVTESLGVQVIVDNRGGGGGTLGAAIAARAAPDGYTLMMGSIASLGTAQGLFKDLSYNPLTDFTPITLAARSPSGFLTALNLPAKSVKEVIALAKAQPGKLNYSSSGGGSPSHLGMELFKSMAGVSLVHIPYRGPAEALNALVMNEAQVEIQSMLSATPFVQGGRLRLLATTGSKRIAEYPDVPTVAEAAVPGYAVYTWFGVVAPAGVPQPVLTRLHAALVQALTSPEMRKQFTNQGAEVVANSPAEFSAFLREEVAKWNKVIRDSGARID